MIPTGTDFLSQTMVMLIYQAPSLLLYAIGIVVAFTKRRRCPRASTLVIVAMSLLIAVILVGSFIHAYLFASMQGAGASTVYQYVAVNAWIIRILNVVGIGFLLTAVFVGRAPAPDADDE